jgi:hypothetical protein
VGCNGHLTTEKLKENKPKMSGLIEANIFTEIEKNHSLRITSITQRDVDGSMFWQGL